MPRGVDGKPDYQTAARWFRKAAGYGVADSQYNLAVLYTRVEQNLAEAYRWFALAARDGDAESACKRDDLATHLDQRSLQAALQAVQAFVSEPQPEAAVLVKTPAGGWDQITTSSTLPPPKRRVIGPKLDLATPTSAQ
jgi:localization factor PodJL